MSEQTKAEARVDTMGNPHDSPTAGSNEVAPPPVSESFLRGVVGATTSYTEGWRALAARTLWLEAEVKKFKKALENHLCHHDMADWLACSFDHVADCYVCADDKHSEGWHAIIKDRETLKAFAIEVLSGYRSGEVGDLDGGELEDIGLRHGLLVPTPENEDGEVLYVYGPLLEAQPAVDAVGQRDE